MGEKRITPEVFTVTVTGYRTNRQVERIGNDLVTGECTYELVLSFPNGKKHLAKVSHEAFDSYIEASGVKMSAGPASFVPAGH